MAKISYLDDVKYSVYNKSNAALSKLFCLNKKLVADKKGICPYGIPAVIIGLLVYLFMGFTTRRQVT
jgi:hypothetical protein